MWERIPRPSVDGQSQQGTGRGIENVEIHHGADRAIENVEVNMAMGCIIARRALVTSPARVVANRMRRAGEPLSHPLDRHMLVRPGNEQSLVRARWY